jgi:hypothetical protein
MNFKTLIPDLLQAIVDIYSIQMSFWIKHWMDIAIILLIIIFIIALKCKK